MSFTPGPWTAYTTAKNGQPKVAKRGGRTLAAVGSWSGSPTFDEDLANARLIAAAPDLLEALHGAMFFVPMGTLARDRADAAIAKAEQKKDETAPTKPTVLVVLEGGLIRDIFCTHPLEVETDIFDLDVNDEDFTNENGDYMRAHLASGNVRRVTTESPEVSVNTDKYPYVLTAEGPKPSKGEATDA